jgi:large subunit ribosomal protein L21
MYSIIACGGFQHKVTPGERLQISRVEAGVGDVVTVSDVLLFADGDQVQIGKPKVDGATVKLEVLRQDRDDKVIVFKKHRRKRYRRTHGHRQHFTEVLVTEMVCGAAKASVDEKTRERALKRATALSPKTTEAAA